VDTRQLPADDNLSKNVAYLEEHELIEAKWPGNIAAPGKPASIKITARGLDFLAGDGGLSAVLNVVTVRIDQDTLKSLVMERIDASGETETIRSKLKEQIKTLPAEATKTITMELLKAGLARIPDIVPVLQNLFSH
jgi:hypothetical protein